MNITQLTEKYISDHPYIRTSLKKGLINYSSLTRLIAKDAKIDLKNNFDAILIAARRFKQKIKKTSPEKEIVELLTNSKIEVKNKIIAIVLDKSVPISNLELIGKKIRSTGEVLRVIESASAITFVTSEDYAKEIEKTFKNNIIENNSKLVEVTLKTSQDIEKIPGVMAYLYSLFSDTGINIIETMSCWTDTIFIVEEKDLAKVMEILRF